MNGLLSGNPLLAVLAGALAAGGLVVFVMAVRGLPSGPPGRRSARLERQLRQMAGTRGALALLVLGWRTLGGAAGERRAMMRLEALATWTESLRDTIAGAVGLEQAIPASLRVAAPSLQEPLARLVDRLHTRVPMPEALRTLADDLDDPSADLIIGALIINARLRGPGLRDLLGALSTAVREELDMRRKVNAERRSTRRSAQIVVLVSVGLALGLALLNPGYVHVYDSPLGQLVLVVVVALYAAGFIWMRRLATFDAPERLLTGPPPVLPSDPEAAGPEAAGPEAAGPEAVSSAYGGGP